MKKLIIALVVAILAGLGGIIGYAATHETIPAGYVGYVYDRTAKADDGVIEGTSVLDVERTGRIRINPISQEVLMYPTTIISKNWTSLEEGDNKEDMSMQAATQEGKNIDADIYVSVRPVDIEKIIRSFGTKNFDTIIDNDIYGLVKGRLSTVSQAYSVYDIQSSRSEIQNEVFDALSSTLMDIYGVELVRFEIGTLNLPADIQQKIDEKTQAQNEVELAKLESEKQNEVNQRMVVEQEAQSKKETLQRQAEADAAAYEKQKAAEAELAVAEANVKIAEQQLKIAELERDAELARQEAYTDSYFRDRELTVQESAVKAINSSVKTIITSGDGEGFGALLGLKEVFKTID